MTSNNSEKNNSTLMQFRKGMLWFFTIGTFIIGIRHLLPGEAASGGSFDAFCPFGAIESMWKFITTGLTLETTNFLNFAILSGVIFVTLMAGRAFCGWMCPLGAVQEGLANLSRRLSGEKKHIRGKISKARFPTKLPNWADRIFLSVKYLILALVILASVFAVYPPLQQFCPARAVFSFKLTSGLMWSVLITFVITSLLVERIWCRYLCPFGALLAIFNKLSPIHLNADFSACNSCGRCDVECSMGIDDVPYNLNDPECIRCLECLETCRQENALSLVVLKKRSPSK